MAPSAPPGAPPCAQPSAGPMGEVGYLLAKYAADAVDAAMLSTKEIKALFPFPAGWDPLELVSWKRKQTIRPFWS